jgi:hypothetical protein
MRPYLEKTHHKKRAGGVAQGVGPDFKSQDHKKKKKKRKRKKEKNLQPSPHKAPAPKFLQTPIFLHQGKATQDEFGVTTLGGILWCLEIASLPSQVRLWG